MKQSTLETLDPLSEMNFFSGSPKLPEVQTRRRPMLKTPP